MTFFVGIFILVALFIPSVMFRGELVALIRKIKLPRWILYFLAAVPFIIVEEQINCGSAWCYRVLVPPTLIPLLVFMLFLFAGIKLFHAKTVWRPTLVFTAAGVLFELTLGGAHAGLVSLAVAAPLFFVFMLAWVAFSYVFISFIPVAVLLQPDVQR